MSEERPCAFHPDRMTRVSCIRCERPICPDDMISAPVGIMCPICAGRMREGSVGQATYRVQQRTERWPIVRFIQGKQVTQLLIGANVIVFLLMLASGGSSFSGRTLYRFGALATTLGGKLPKADWWRVFSAMFVHVNLFHIFANMFGLLLFGGAMEMRHGRGRFLALYLGSGLLGSAASLAFNPGGGIRAGASGAVFGVLGGWIAFFLRHRHMREAQGQLRSLIFLVGINLFFGATWGGIDNWAHLGGLAGGIIIASGFEIAGRHRTGPQQFAAFAALLLVIGLAAGLIIPHLV